MQLLNSPIICMCGVRGGGGVVVAKICYYVVDTYTKYVPIYDNMVMILSFVREVKHQQIGIEIPIYYFQNVKMPKLRTPHQ